MNDYSITAEHISKNFSLGAFNTGTFVHDLNALLKSRMGRGNTESASKIHKALIDINFNLSPGEIVGIVGKNGAGKSTLLKILSRIMKPDTGSIKIKGRVASLLEVGTGFHPELTGRENIYMNGSLLGMKRAEINSKLDKIIEFSGIEKYIDTPVKRYSSGMTVRLGFSVAAHLESDILIIDEVLAVGDLEFQSKCIKKIKEELKAQKTILIVSHNLTNISDLCKRTLYLKKGSLVFDGDTSEALSHYISDNSIDAPSIDIEPDTSLAASFTGIRIVQEDRNSNIIEVLDEVKISVHLRVYQNVENIIFGLGILTATGIAVNTTWTDAKMLKPGDYEIQFTTSNFNLGEGTYKLLLGSNIDNRVIEYIDKDFIFHIVNTNKNKDKHGRLLSTKNSIIIDQLNYEFQKTT